jgi:mono/diheme cytochrome c family protein
MSFEIQRHRKLISSGTRRLLVRLMTGITLAAMMAASTTAAFAQGSGADDYKAKCAMCHGADGLAANAMGKMYKIPPFNSPDVVKASDADLIAATKNGKGKMQGFAGKLTDPQIKDVVAYIRTLQK